MRWPFAPIRWLGVGGDAAPDGDGVCAGTWLRGAGGSVSVASCIGRGRDLE